MRLLLRISDLFLFTSAFTACCAVSLCMATERLVMGQSPHLFNCFHLFVLGSCLMVYNTPRIVRNPYGIERKHNTNRPWYLFSFSAGLTVTAFCALQLPQSVVAASGVLSVFAFAYFLPMLPMEQKKRLRDFGGLKIAVLAGVWTIATTVLPILYCGKNLAYYPLEFLTRLAFIFTLCVIFDIRDLRADRRNNIDTLPHKVGLRNSYLLINTSLLVFVFLSIMQYLRYPSLVRLGGAVITAVVTRLVANYLNKHPTDRAYAWLADGVMVLYALLVIVPAR